MTIWLEDGLKNQDQSVETASGKLVIPSESHSDDVWKFVTPSESVIKKEALETLARCGENGDEFSLELIEDEDVPLVDGVLEGAFGDLGCVCGEGVLSSSCVTSMNNFLS
ncbi:hypothetical protein Tco_0949968 [Tanacetum coccineum]